MALSFLARPEGIVGFGYGLLFCLTLLVGTYGFKRKNLALPVFFLIGFLLIAGPYLVTLRLTLGGWTLSALTATQVKSADAVLTLNAKGGLQQNAATGLSAWKESYRTLPVFAAAIRENIKGFARVYVGTFPAWMNVATLLGFLLLAWKSPWRNTLLLLALVAVIAPTLVVNLPKTHSYIYPLFALTFICFAFCLDTLLLGGMWVAGKFPALRPRFLEVLLSGILLVPVAYMALTSYRVADASYQMPGLVHEAVETEAIFKGAGEIIKSSSQPRDIIMTRWGLVGYFADRPVLGLPKGGVREVVDYGRKNGAKFLLIDTKSVLSRREELMELLSPLGGTPVNPEYGIEVFARNYIQDIGGYVIYRYK